MGSIVIDAHPEKGHNGKVKMPPLTFSDPGALKKEIRTYDTPFIETLTFNPMTLLYMITINATREKAIQLLWQMIKISHATSVAASVKSEGDAEIESIKEDIKRKKEQIEEYQSYSESLHRQLSLAHINCNSGMVSAGLPPCDYITGAEDVEESLQAKIPSLKEMAAQKGISYYPPTGIAGSLADKACSFIGALICGILLSMALGSMTGLITVNDLERCCVTKLVLAMSLGGIIVYYLGFMVECAVQSLLNRITEAANNIPWFIKIILIAIILVLTAAELGTNTIGIREIHLQNEILTQLNPNFQIIDYPLISYVLIGLLVSSPYLGYKAYRQCSLIMKTNNEALMIKGIAEWEENKRKDPFLQAAFLWGSYISVIRSRIEDCEDKIVALMKALKAIEEHLATTITNAAKRNDSVLEGMIVESSKANGIIDHITGGMADKEEV